jgi:ligand-binding SRPBCC domain-containing protein
MPRTYRLERTQVIPRPRTEVFTFFSDASNLERITPPFVGFRFLTPPPPAIGAGTLIEYQLKLHGFPIRWQTLIETFEPGLLFTDVQLRGPYRRWHHRHEFSDVPGGTRMDDTIDYQLPLGPLGAVARSLFVARALRQIFDFRAERIADFFGGDGPSGSEPPQAP